MSQEFEHKNSTQKSLDEVSPKSASLAGFSALYGEGRKKRSGATASQETREENAGDAGQNLFRGVNTFPDTETGDPVIDATEETEEKSVSFDELFSGLSEMLPVIVWSIVCFFMGKPEDQLSTPSLKKMKAGWEKFFKACGVEYVGEGLNVRLASPLWLLLLPVVATLAAITTEFGITSLFDKKGENPAKTDEKMAA